MRGFSPMTAGMHIHTVAAFPFFPDPYVSGAGSSRPDDDRGRRTDLDIDLGRGREGIGGDDQTG
jgi:hypothetical protein